MATKTPSRRTRRKAGLDQLEADLKHANAMVEALEAEVYGERLRRVAAQRGLVPYVTAVQALNAWLGERPELMETLGPILKQLGLYGVKVGYDPDKDLSLSVIAGATRKGRGRSVPNDQQSQ